MPEISLIGVMKKSKIYGFLALPRSYFSLTTSPAIALLVSFMAGLSELKTLTLLGFFYLFSTAFLNSYNNLMDARSDALTKDKFPIPLGLVTFREASLFSASTFTVAAVLAALIASLNNFAGYMAFANLALGFLYSAPNVRLKRFPLIKGGVLVAHTLLTPFIVANLILGHNPLHRINPLIPLFLIGLAVHIVQDIGDVEGDKLMGDKTLPILLGVKNSVILALGLIIVSAMLIIFYEGFSKVLALVLTTAQLPLLCMLLIREEMWKYVFWTCSTLSAGVVASILHGCCG